MSKVLDSVNNLLNEKLVQISLVGTILFYIVASPTIFTMVKDLFTKLLGIFHIDFTLEGQWLTFFNAVVFGFLLYLTTKYLMDPVVKLAKSK